MRVSNIVPVLITFGLFTASAAHALTITIPVQEGMIANALGTGCAPSFNGVSSPATCEALIPISLPAGSQIQQIRLIYGTNGPHDGSRIAATVWEVNYATSIVAQTFSLSSTQGPAIGSYGSVQLMAGSGKNFPDAFFVDAQTLYNVNVYADHGFVISGLQVTYQ